MNGLASVGNGNTEMLGSHHGDGSSTFSPGEPARPPSTVTRPPDVTMVAIASTLITSPFNTAQHQLLQCPAESFRRNRAARSVGRRARLRTYRCFLTGDATTCRPAGRPTSATTRVWKPFPPVGEPPVRPGYVSSPRARTVARGAKPNAAPATPQTTGSTLTVGNQACA